MNKNKARGVTVWIKTQLLKKLQSKQCGTRLKNGHIGNEIERDPRNEAAYILNINHLQEWKGYTNGGKYSLQNWWLENWISTCKRKKLDL